MRERNKNSYSIHLKLNKRQLLHTNTYKFLVYLPEMRRRYAFRMVTAYRVFIAITAKTHSNQGIIIIRHRCKNTQLTSEKSLKLYIYCLMKKKNIAHSSQFTDYTIE